MKKDLKKLLANDLARNIRARFIDEIPDLVVEFQTFSWEAKKPLFTVSSIKYDLINSYCDEEATYAFLRWVRGMLEHLESINCKCSVKNAKKK